MKSPNDRRHRLRPTELCGTRGTCSTTQGKFGQAAEVCGCLVTLPKPSHILPLRLVAMRPFLTLVAIVVSGSAQAQFPYSYGPYPPRDPPYGGQYAPPAQNRSPASIAQAMLDAHNAIRARVGVPPLVWSDQLSQVAQDWANHLIATGSFGHRPNNRYGENLYSISGGAASPAQVVGYWARGGAGIRYSQQYLLRRLRPLHADRVGHDTGSGLRRRHRSAARGLGVQLRSARKHRRLPTILSSAFHWSRPSS